MSAPPPTPADVIAKKRDGLTLDEADIATFVRGATDGSWADYQLSALLMAIYLRGMSATERSTLTLAMMRSGALADLSHIPGLKVDKHSTGGVGDKVSLPLAALVAACGVPVPMISGRGLGHTGGTLDKLESIPGFRVDLSLADYAAQVARIGCALIGQTRDLAPADRKLYALRDVTATVDCLPLICASILSKKMAEGIDALVLDVKVGRGAFMRTLPEALALAEAMCEIGRGLGRPTRALLTRMDQPLGHTVGNALEVAEALACLRGSASPDSADLLELTLDLGVEMLLLGKVTADHAEARARLQRALADGSALEKFRAIVAAQGGDPRVCDHPESVLPQAPLLLEVRATGAGYIGEVDALEIAHAALALGAGRTRAEDRVDPAVGFSRLVKIGRPVAAGDLLGLVHARDPDTGAAAATRLRSAVRVVEQAPAPLPLVLGRVG
jgi:pyrimidine-nucleoside phosphorylase